MSPCRSTHAQTAARPRRPTRSRSALRTWRRRRGTAECAGRRMACCRSTNGTPIRRSSPPRRYQGGHRGACCAEVNQRILLPSPAPLDRARIELGEVAHDGLQPPARAGIHDDRVAFVEQCFCRCAAEAVARAGEEDAGDSSASLFGRSVETCHECREVLPFPRHPPQRRTVQQASYTAGRGLGT